MTLLVTWYKNTLCQHHQTVRICNRQASYPAGYFRHPHILNHKHMLAVLTAHDAIEIYKAKKNHTRRDNVSEILSQKYQITMKAIRDIWNLRTWKEDTKPYWTLEDQMKYLQKNQCSNCKSRKVHTLDKACETCNRPTKRGRPSKLDTISKIEEEVDSLQKQKLDAQQKVFLLKLQIDKLDKMIDVKMQAKSDIESKKNQFPKVWFETGGRYDAVENLIQMFQD